MEKIVSIIDKSFMPGSEKKNFLSIELSPGGFSYCILDTDKFKYRVLESFAFGYPLDEENISNASEYLIKSNELLQNDYERVSISYVSPQFVFIPEDIYVDSEKKSYLDFNVQLDDDNFFVNSEKLNNLKAYSVYPVAKVITSMLFKFFPELRIRHYTSPLIESIMYNVAVSNLNADVILHLNNGFFEIIIIENNTLKLVKAFNFITYDDLMYYVFFTLENMGFDAEKLNLKIIGNVSMESELYKNIRLYFKSVSFGERNDLYRYSSVFDNIPHHYFYGLLNLNVCG
ncbi:MAG: DUF3822 family protein [Bacteroidales bacterium]